MIRDFNSDDDDDEESGDDRGGFGIDIGIGVRTIADILRELDERGHVSGSGRRGDVDFGYSAGTGIGTGPRPSDERDRDRDRDGPSRPRKKRSWPSESDDDYLVESRREDDELVVTADLPGVDADELVLGLDGDADELVLGVGDRSVERVPLPWERVEMTDATFNNGVLVARLREETDA